MLRTTLTNKTPTPVFRKHNVSLKRENLRAEINNDDIKDKLTCSWYSSSNIYRLSTYGANNSHDGDMSCMVHSFLKCTNVYYQDSTDFYSRNGMAIGLRQNLANLLCIDTLTSEEDHEELEAYILVSYYYGEDPRKLKSPSGNYILDYTWRQLPLTCGLYRYCSHLIGTPNLHYINDSSKYIEGDYFNPTNLVKELIGPNMLSNDVMKYICNVFNIEVVFLEAYTDDLKIYMGGHVVPQEVDDNTLVIFINYAKNHYEAIGLETKPGLLQTIFRRDHPFYVTYLRMEESIRKGTPLPKKSLFEPIPLISPSTHDILTGAAEKVGFSKETLSHYAKHYLSQDPLEYARSVISDSKENKTYIREEDVIDSLGNMSLKRIRKVESPTPSIPSSPEKLPEEHDIVLRPSPTKSGNSSPIHYAYTKNIMTPLSLSPERESRYSRQTTPLRRTPSRSMSGSAKSTPVRRNLSPILTTLKPETRVMKDLEPVLASPPHY